jgi:isopropylmalate/homocitrate/citramalate synthase
MYASAPPGLGFFTPARGVRVTAGAFGDLGADHSSSGAQASNDTGTTVANIIGGVAQGAASIIGSIFGAQGAASNAQGAAAMAQAQMAQAQAQMAQAQAEAESRNRMLLIGGAVALAAIGAIVVLKK